ncbi:MAG: hypothetical protein MPJ50_02295 [Pirellulales bacterium]|nr:hypothetical protein [Pirellulales bacterium]
MLLKLFLVFPAVFALAITDDHPDVAAGSAVLDASTKLVAGQQPESDESELRLFPLANTSAQDAVRIVYESLELERTRLTADPRSNAVIASGTADELEQIADLLNRLDVVGQSQPGERRLKVFALVNANCRQVVEIMERLLDVDRMSLAVDQRTNSILVRGSSENVQVVEALISHLDREIGNDTEANQQGGTEFTVVNLEFTSAEETAALVEQAAIGMPLNIVADSRRNALLIRGDAAAVEFVKTILDSLDVPGDNELYSIRTYALRHADADQVLDAVSSVFSGMSDVRASVDSRTNTIIFYASDSHHEQIESLLRELDGTNESAAMTDTSVENRESSYKIRLIWLSAGEESVERGSLTEGLQPVAAELASYGFDNLELAGQMMVNSTGSIECAGRILYGGEDYYLQSAGLVHSEGKRLRLTLNVSLSTGRGSGRFPVAQASTQIFTQPGHFTVLGVSPADNKTAIFVVQILED